MTEFKQYELQPPQTNPLNIESTPGGSMVKEGVFQSPNFARGFKGWNLDSDGDAEFNSIFVRNAILTVELGGDIQSAITIISNAGGGEVKLSAGTFYPTSDIVIPSGVKLVGSGRDVTIIDFQDESFDVEAIGTAGTPISNFELADLTIQNSTATAGLDIDNGVFFRISNVRVTGCSGKGVRLDDCIQSRIENLKSDNNTGNGIDVIDSSTDSTELLLINCLAQDNGDFGYYFNTSTSDLVPIVTIIGCVAKENNDNGFEIVGSGSLLFVGCTSALNPSSDGFHQSGSSQHISFIGCFSAQNTIGFYIEDSGSILSGNASVGDSTSFDVPAGTIFSGNDGDPRGLLDDYEQTKSGRKSNILMKNVSGGTIVKGDVVVLGTAATADEITTTTSAGSNRVFGMMANNSANNNSDASILTTGFTDSLKVDGTTDIAVGDYLSTFTTAGISAKASAGHTIFAIALEAYTTNDSNGVIDAILIEPRLI